MNRAKFILVLCLLIITILIGSFAISVTLIALLGNLSPVQIELLWILPAAFTICFILAQIIGTKLYNLATRTIYTSMAVWMGTYVYLLLAAVLTNLLILFGIHIGIYLMTAAVLASVYGIFHAKNIQIKRIEIKLDNLPAAWKGKKAVFVSDLHLGLIHGKNFAAKVAKIINSQNPEIIFIGGDLYDGSIAAIAHVTSPLSELKATHGVYMVLGNHEQFGEIGPFVKGAQEAGIQVLEEEYIDILGLRIAGISHSETEDRKVLPGFLAKLHPDKNTPAILLSHEPRNIDLTEAAGFSLQLSGHTHRAQQWPLGYIPKRIFKGFDYGLKNSGKTQVYTSSGVGTWGPPMRVGTDSEIVVITF